MYLHHLYLKSQATKKQLDSHSTSGTSVPKVMACGKPVQSLDYNFSGLLDPNRQSFEKLEKWHRLGNFRAKSTFNDFYICFTKGFLLLKILSPSSLPWFAQAAILSLADFCFYLKYLYLQNFSLMPKHCLSSNIASISLKYKQTGHFRHKWTRTHSSFVDKWSYSIFSVPVKGKQRLGEC